jgi:3-hydroxyisobutyrate dehydrogenase-like beta-hydroxyacid dehydrogenase
MRDIAGVIHSGNFANPTATLRIWRSALQPIRQQARDAGINSTFPDQVDQLLAKAEAAGYAEENVMAIVKVLREANS